MSNTKHSPAIKLSIGLIAAATAIDQVYKCLQGGKVSLITDFDWASVDAHVELATFSKAVYCNEAGPVATYIQIGRTETLSGLSVKTICSINEIHNNSFRKAVNLGSHMTDLTGEVLTSIFDSDGSCDSLSESTLKLLPKTISVITNLIRSMESRRVIGQDTISPRDIATIIASTMVWSEINAAVQ